MVKTPPKQPVPLIAPTPVLRYPAINIRASTTISKRDTNKTTRRLHDRKVSWANQTTSRRLRPTSSQATPEQAAHKSFYEDGPSRESTGSTLSLTSTLGDSPASARTTSSIPNKNNTDPGEHSEPTRDKKMSATLAVARNLNQNKCSIWNPDDDEWLDASKVLDTFKASYKIPTPRSPIKGSAFMTFGATIKSVLLSPTKKAKEEEQDEEVEEKIDELGNTFAYDPDGDLNDEVMAATFLAPTHYFPSHIPDSLQYMHLINLDAYFTSTSPLLQHARPRLCDAVATVLSHTSKECLKAFLDPRIREFVYRRKVDNNEGGRTLIIRREGTEVICGAYHNLAFKKLWRLYVKSVVGPTGQWHEVYATLKTGEMAVTGGVPEWGTILPEPNKEVLGFAMTESVQRKLELSPSKKNAKTSDVSGNSPKFMLYQSRMLAERLLWDIWYRLDKKYECRAVWTTDGVESGVRLKRALVGSQDLDD
jgi:hypothetical protein